MQHLTLLSLISNAIHYELHDIHYITYIIKWTHQKHQYKYNICKSNIDLLWFISFNILGLSYLFWRQYFSRKTLFQVKYLSLTTLCLGQDVRIKVAEKVRLPEKTVLYWLQKRWENGEDLLSDIICDELNYSIINYACRPLIIFATPNTFVPHI